MLARHRDQCRRIFLEADELATGMLEMTNGFLSEKLVPVAMVSKLLEHVRSNVLTVPQYKRMKLKITHSNPAFYYSTRKKTMYWCTNDYFNIMLTIPLNTGGAGLMTVYKVDTYPVNLGAGQFKRQNVPTMARTTAEQQKYMSTSTIINMPQYFAVSPDLEYYVQMDATYYESCKGNDEKTGSLHVCRGESPTMLHGSVKTCVKAMFDDSTDDILSECQFSVSSSASPGSAVQLGDTNTYLVHGSTTVHDEWIVNCPTSNRRVRNIIPAQFLLLDVPCFCSLRATGFFVPYRISGCSADTSFTDGDIVSVRFPINSLVAHLFSNTSSDDIDSKNLKGDTVRIGRAWPAIRIPKDVYDVSWSRSLDEVIASTKQYSVDMRKSAKLNERNIQTFKSNQDMAIKKAMNMSDIQEILDREGSVTKAFKDALRLFPKLGIFLTVITSPGFLGLVAVCLNGLPFTLTLMKMKNNTLGKRRSVRGVSYNK
uniref:Membrane-fusion protein n=1 Tax=Malaco herpesvirus 4 TaxID=3031800 RepID=A0AA48P8Z3_9VIRU|nr:TPA_asm: membrane-fusion protein [Malaco herpesvirus 4]